MLKGASLLYAVFLCAIIATLCAILLFVFSVSKLELDRLLITNNFTTVSTSCFDQFSWEETNQQSKPPYLNNKFDLSSCEIASTSWGLLPLLKQKVFFKKDTLIKNIFAGIRNQTRPALYKADHGNSLKISGTSKINGDVFIPNARVERATILGNQSINNPQLLGDINKSKQQLPDIIDTNFKFPKIYTTMNLEDLKSDKEIVNSFSKPTIVISGDTQQKLGNISLKGNIILITESYIELSANSVLEDIIIISPQVKIKTGFRGSIQVYASKSIFVGQSVELKYPSNLILNSSSSIQDNITISKKSKIYGNIILNSNTAVNKEYGSIAIEDEVFICGSLYCKGQLQLKGVFLGSVYTDYILYKTKYSEYTDVLLNVTINATGLGSDFVSIPLLKNNRRQLLGIIKEL